jgi:hypothetical protein
MSADDRRFNFESAPSTAELWEASNNPTFEESTNRQSKGGLSWLK